jgi:GT2 family glycosyltransferase
MRLSIVVASYNSRATIEACLESLLRQKTGSPFEVVVADSSNDGTADLIAERFPAVRLLRLAGRKFPGTARNAAIAAGTAPLIAFTDADCIAREDYVEALLEAHRDPAAAIGGAIANYEPANAVSWASYFCEFSEWMPGAPFGKAGNLATANASYKRWAFEKCGAFLEGTYGSDTDFNWRLIRDGQALLWSPSIFVSHRSIGRLGTFLRHEFSHGRDCCRMRIRSQRFSRLRRWFYAACFPLIPVKLFAQIAARVIRRRLYLWKFLSVVPLVAAGLGCWCSGELVAFLKPEYGADRRQA